MFLCGCQRRSRSERSISHCVLNCCQHKALGPSVAKLTLIAPLHALGPAATMCVFIYLCLCERGVLTATHTGSHCLSITLLMTKPPGWCFVFYYCCLSLSFIIGEIIKQTVYWPIHIYINRYYIYIRGGTVNQFNGLVHSRFLSQFSAGLFFVRLSKAFFTY